MESNKSESGECRVHNDEISAPDERYILSSVDSALSILNLFYEHEELGIPAQAAEIAIVDATGISENLFGRNMPNTSMLGALAKVTDLVSKDALFDEIAAAFGEANRTAAQTAYDSVVITKKEA